MKKIYLGMSVITIMIFSSSCGLMSNKNEIKESFEEKLSMYPIKHLEDFYDKEGFRDGEFDKNDKGTWILNSSIAVRESKDGDLNVKGMVLDINRNTKMSKGQYYYKTIKEDSKGRIYKQEKNYPVKLENNKIVPLKPINDEKIRKEIEDFRFFVQYADFKDLNSYGTGNFDYNPNVPSYSAEYQLSNDDHNVKQLRKRYDISTNKAPKLILTGVGEFKGSSVGYKNLKMEFEQTDEKSTNFSDTVSFKPSR
ncbi:tandem-type lipoprotein [Staphylococcus agnetis]|uniref:tandem-type lipoprotein n=1 Tax=Staphylococcus agnetis TaxID=985762 RepID=UPI0021D37A3D|nr:tandem-type lipoprotein [Staphylococcus agnetis]UXU56013.1 tandem-type lipoprotein [Staphylococcus agnetis]UXU65300.1 tandem-type lipoprotein [Staphylococcus agnetis]UXU67670.1 tandem-type lipoprotein [Staphylococcus agnetis]